MPNVRFSSVFRFAVAILFAVLVPGSESRAVPFPLPSPSRPTTFPLVRPSQIGVVVAWGKNDFGQTNVPPGLFGVVALAAGEVHTVALKNDGSVVEWGGYRTQQTNKPEDLRDVVAISAGAQFTIALKDEGTVIGWGGIRIAPEGLHNMVAISAGAYHAAALKSDGTVIAWGYNGYGQTNVTQGLSDVVAIAAGTSHTVALRSDGTVVAWGSNLKGESNVPEGLRDVVAIAAGDQNTFALKSDGMLVGWGNDSYGKTVVPADLRDVVAIEAAEYHTIARTSDGIWRSWGRNLYGQTNVLGGLRDAFAMNIRNVHTVALVLFELSVKIAPDVSVPEFTIRGPAGWRLWVERSATLGAESWISFTNVILGPSGFQLADMPVGLNAGFYRAVNGDLVPTGMAWIPTGPFEMGDTFDDRFGTDAKPVHTVYVSAFAMDKYEVTFGLWRAVREWSIDKGYDLPDRQSSSTRPVDSVNWFDAVKWCNARSEKEGLVPAYYLDEALTQVYRSGQTVPYVNWARGYRLPTEAEWEKAARGGARGHRFPWSDVDTITHDRANYSSSTLYDFDVSPTRGRHPKYGIITAPVGSFAANDYGLYDMAGNVWEWCWDWFGSYSDQSESNPRGPSTGSFRVVRGGIWYNGAPLCQVAFRISGSPSQLGGSHGFRSVLPFGGQPN